MGIDLWQPGIMQTYATWPKCHPCSVRLQRPYPVEVFGFVAREPGRENAIRQYLVFEVQCHDARQLIRLAVPYWWGNAIQLDALGEMFCFRRGGLGTLAEPEHKQVVRIK